MARLIFSVGLLSAVLVHAPRALADDVADVAAEHDYDEAKLRGALISLGLPQTAAAAKDYVAWELRPAPPPIADVWRRLADCESSGRWSINSGNSYYGGLQEDLVFWRRHGGLQYAPRPDLATPAEQVAVAITGQKVQGWSAWPACSRRLGLR